MRLSTLFSKTRKEAPKDEVSKNASLLVRAGFVDKLSAGVYSYLPLGLLALRNIEAIIRKEMNALGGQEIIMPALQPKEIWEQTGRWNDLDILYKVTDQSGKEMALGPTHEEVVVPLAKNFISSYRDLPTAVYQFQNKFRMEPRAKSGLLRGREFLMKDLYSFHRDQEDLERFYGEALLAYKRIYEAVGLGKQTHLTFASGGSFSKYSHEFQTITEAGEDTIYVCNACQKAINKEVKEPGVACPSCGQNVFTEKKAIEVGNIFMLKDQFSKPFNLVYKNEEGKEEPILMGCYGIGLSRLLGTIAEVHSDEAGLIWPEAVAPAKLHIVDLTRDPANANVASALYEEAILANVTAILDDRPLVSPGAKLAEADLLGMPTRVVVSDRNLAEGVLEIKMRNESDSLRIPLSGFASTCLS